MITLETRMWLRRVLTRQPPWIARYGLALTSVAVALFVTQLLERAPLFMPAILLSAWYGGAGAGLFAIVLTLMATKYFLMAPQLSFRIVSPPDVVYLLVFALSALFVVWITLRERRAGDALREAHDDLTAHTRELRRSESYLQETQKLGHVGSWASTAAGESFISPETLRMFGYDPNETHPTRDMIMARCHPDDRVYVDQKSVKNRAERSEYELDFRIVLPDGSLKYVHSVAHPIFDDAGELVEYVGAIQDMTERKQASDALQEAQAQLAHVTRVSMLGEITASIAHEVNQPLAAVVMNANACARWLSTDPPNLAEAQAATQRIASDGNRAADVVARVRALVKKAPSETTTLDVNDVIAETLLFTRSEAARRGVAMRTDLSERLPTLAGDRVQLQQVLVNLILNGIDAMSDVRERARVLTIRSRSDDAENVLVEVEDAGTGLAADTPERIFEPFYSTKPAGLGIGLAVSRSIVELHGGRISANPNDGPGVTMRVSLPVSARA